MPFAPLIAAVVALMALVAARLIRPGLGRTTTREGIRIGRLVDHTGLDSATGAVYSIQAATITTPTARLDEIWSPAYLERLARSYWQHMERFSLGLVRVHYSDRGRFVCFVSRRICLLSFDEPEYEFGATVGVVRWPIGRGLLVSRYGRNRGFLEIEVHRRDDVGTDPDGEPMSQAFIELEVSQFYPTMSSGFAYWVYKQTQSRYHVLLAYNFIRSLARVDLPESAVGRFASWLGGDLDAELVGERDGSDGSSSDGRPPSAVAEGSGKTRS